MTKKSFDVLCQIQYAYDANNTYYEVMGRMAVSEDAAIAATRAFFSRPGAAVAMRITNVVIVAAKPAGSFDKFVGKRVGQFIDEVCQRAPFW